MSAQRGFVPLITIAAVLILFVTIGGLFIYTHKAPTPKNTPALSLEDQENSGDFCYSQNYFKALSEREFVTAAQLSHVADPNININRGIGFVSWRRAGDEPVVSFPGQTFLAYDRSPLPFQKINEYYKSKFEPLLFAKGFIKDAANSYYSPENNKIVYQGESETYGYHKGNLILVVGVGATSSEDDQPKTSSFGLGCAKRDNQYDQIYSELIFSQAGKKVLEEAYGKNGLKNMIFSIWNIYQPNIIRTNISSRDWFGGHSAWFYKTKSGEWEVFHTGQDHPTCAELEKRGAEKGISCNKDMTSDTTK